MDGNRIDHEGFVDTSNLDAVRPSKHSASRIDAENNMIDYDDPWADDAFADPDTCRICRGEGSFDEPLFYPCKCSGSIKYVHQNCLMEWLSHSQKKHCELCKTPFRFTKLYSPDMPQRLPFHIFVSHMTRYLFRNLLVWLRAALVTSVWLGWLPYLMRSLWSLMFWISDEGLHVPIGSLDVRNVTGMQGLRTVSVSVTGTTTCPSTPLLPVTTTAASLGAIMDRVPVSSLMKAISAPLNDSSTANSWLRAIYGRIFFGLSAHPHVPNVELVDNVNVTVHNIVGKAANAHSQGSLLSEVGFLNRFTRSPTINRIMISVLEGQIITVSVIVCFILIILVRDYVVQQQPEIHMRAVFAAVEEAENDMAQPPPPAALLAEHLELAGVPHLGQTDGEGEGDSDSSDDSDESDESGNDDVLEVDGHNEDEELHHAPSSAQVHTRRLATMRTRSLNTPDRSGTANVSPDASRSDHATGRRAYEEAEVGSSLSGTSSVIAEKASSDSSGWTWAGTDDEVGPSGTMSDKGKAKAEGSDQGDEPSSSSSVPISALRPRATSDGRQGQLPINPLASNNWSFSNLPPDSASEGLGSESGDLLFGTRPLSPDLATSTAEIPLELPSDSSGLFINSQTTYDPVDRGVESPTPYEVGGPGALEVDADNAGDVGEVVEPAPVAMPDSPRAVAAPPPNTIVERVADFMWGDVPEDADGGNQEEAVDIFGDNQNPPFMHAAHGGRNEAEAGEGDEEDERQMAPDVVEAAAAAGIDAEVVEDGEDFDGIMELIGMRGPIAGLFQNAIFCACLVSLSILIGIFVPYNAGRLAAWILANPVPLVRLLFSFAKLAQESALLAVGYVSTFLFNIAEACRLLLGTGYGKQILRTLRMDARQLSNGALDRIVSTIVSFGPLTGLPVDELIHLSVIGYLSAVSHHALLVLRGNLRACALAFGQALLYIFSGDYLAKLAAARELWKSSWPALVNLTTDLPSAVSRLGSWAGSLHNPKGSPIPLDVGLAHWSGYDRTWAILIGYGFIAMVVAMYLAWRRTTQAAGQTAQGWEASLIDVLNQASGVMKVILIISIEMLVFPLYCGLLLDVALLPLFENTTLRSRLLFAYNHPFTSIFMHWFIGTGYMFHFALFVSMCRKIMRKGVLYFIRDPDDPEFHPVRDVLERNVTTQLRKILFSALVYGALVIVCLGGVVWGLSLAIPNVLPIHYTYNEPVLEFPVDLLFCNFLMPLAVKFFKPSDGLHAMYTWWFRKCASALRLTWFLFGERQVEEEGRLVLEADAANGSESPAWRRMFLGVDEENEVVPKGWGEFLGSGASEEESEPSSKPSRQEMLVMNEQKASLVARGRLIPDGRYVRSPASDQAKIPKGQAVFVDVSEEVIRKHYESTQPETMLLPDSNYQIVYVPPRFRARIFTFILSIWIFAAVTGVSSTILPLVFGRRIFKALVPPHIRTNDIYAFSIGVYVLSSASYVVFHLHVVLDKIREWTSSAYNSMLSRHALERAIQLAKRTFKLTYAYTMLLLVFPILITVLVEMYLLMPLHTYLYSLGPQDENGVGYQPDKHNFSIPQAWTLGILYLKLGSRALTLYGGRPAHAVRAVLRRGWLEPDVSVLNRAFVIPGFVASALMLFTPPFFARVALSLALDSSSPISYEMEVSANRFAYPLSAMFCVALLVLRRVLRIFQGWQIRIRDEAYLMGERLHNFSGTAAKASAWRATSRM